MFNLPPEVIEWLKSWLRHKWLWGVLVTCSVFYAVWTAIPDKYQTKLLDYVLEDAFEAPEAADAAILPMLIRPENDEGLSWLRFKVERNLVEYLTNQGLRVAHELAATERRSDAPKVITGSLQKNLDGSIEITLQLAEKGTVKATTSFAAPYDFLKNHYHALPETLIYGLDVDPANLKLLKTKQLPTTSLAAFAVYIEAKKAMAHNDAPTARKLLQEALTLDPSFAMSAWSMGEIYTAEGKASDAKSWYDKAAAINKDHPRWPFLAQSAKPLPDLMLALQAAPWGDIRPGLIFKDVTLKAYGIRVLAWQFSKADYRLALGVQSAPQGASVRDFRKANGAILAINGGFFEIDTQARLSPSGLLVTSGKQISAYRKEAGSGVVYVSDRGVGISAASGYESVGKLLEAVQSGPLVVERGRNGIYKDDMNRLNRSALCVRKDEMLIIAVFGGLSLYELGEMLAAKPENGGFGCNMALNLDGGPSTQISFRVGTKAIEAGGLWKINNALLVLEKAP